MNLVHWTRRLTSRRRQDIRGPPHASRDEKTGCASPHLLHGRPVVVPRMLTEHKRHLLTQRQEGESIS
jgi:hypothetical protein